MHMHETYKTMLRGASRALFACLTLVGAMLPVACVYDHIPEAGVQADTYIHLSLSASEAGTRAVSDDHKGETDENTITSLRVWAFDANNSSESATALCYKEETNLNVTAGLHTFTMKLPRTTGGQPLTHIDLYILANAESGSNLTTSAENRRLTRKELQAKVVSEQFGVNSEGTPQNMSVPSAGLPMSRIVENIPIEGYVTEDETVTKPSINIGLTRAVSKLHFFFARRSNSGTDGVEVTGIEVGKSTVPVTSYVFPQPVQFANPVPDNGPDTRSYTNFVDYAVSRKYKVTVGDIPAVADPKDLKRGSNEDADTYMSRLAKANLKGQYLTYLRETDQEVTVTIRYRLGENEKEKTATVNISAGDLRRNHEVLVYGYFLDGGALLVEPQVLPWVDGGQLDFMARREVTLSHGTVRVSQAEGERVAIAYQDWTKGATPARSPLLTIEIHTDSHRWILQTDNPDFGFLIDGEKQLRDQLTGYDGTVKFYLMPRRDINLAQERNRKASIFMTLPEDDNSRVLINTGDGKLPGSEESILFYQTTADEYDKLK